TLQATSSGLTTGTSPSFSILDKATLDAPPPGTVTAGVPFGLVADVGDLSSVDPLFNGSMTIALAPGSTQATLGGTFTVPVVRGVADFSGLPLDQAGTYRFLLNGNGFTGTTTGPISVTGGAATRLAVTAQPAAVTTGSGFALEVTAEDAFGNPDPTFNGN